MKFKPVFLFLLAAASVFLFRCANPVMPLGGAKDTLPPQIVSSSPANYAVNFSSRTVVITFNEYIKLNKINQQALISPPPQTNPEYRIKGKSLQVRFAEDLKPETTYTLFFGDAIVDLTESNPLSGFTFVFSTGPVLDSMALRGNVSYAFDLKAAEGAYVFLYRFEDDTIPPDSLPFLKKPYYVARTDKKGNFRFSNLRNEPYRMYALDDKNTNFLYDKGGEAIAFVADSVFPQFLANNAVLKELDADTIVADSLLHPTDPDHDHSHAHLPTAATEKRILDSIAYARKVFDDSLRFAKLSPNNLKLFYEVDSTQKLLRAEVVKNGQLRFAFRYPAGNVTVEPLDTLPDNFGLLRNYSPKKDTITWYYRDSIMDTLQIVVRLDTLFNDTLKLMSYPKSSGTARRNARKKESENALAFFTPVSGRKLDVDKSLVFSFPEPVVRFQMRDSSRFIAAGDTVYNQVNFVKLDEAGLQYKFDYNLFEPEKEYHLRFPDSVFFSLSGKTNDTVDLVFKVPALSEYGNLYLDVKPEAEVGLIIQLLLPKGDVFMQNVINGSSRVVYEKMKPAKYVVKAIADLNGNGRWDTGDLLGKKQAEPVYYLEKEIEIRANWDLEEEFPVKNAMK